MTNFSDPGSVDGLIGLWDFRSGAENKDTGLDDGVAQNGHFHGGAYASSDQLKLDGYCDYFDVSGEDAPFDLSEGTIEVQFQQDQQVGTSPDVLVNRGEYCDKHSEGWFAIRVTEHGEVLVDHYTKDGTVATLKTDPGLVDPHDVINVSYSWDADTGATLTVENLTDGTSQTVESDVTGLTMDIGDNDDENFTFGAREVDDGEYDQYFDGKIDYVAIYDSVQGEGDFIVEGTSGDDLIDVAYTGDPENDSIDAGDNQTGGDEDLVDAGAGGDTILSGAADDTVYAGSGDDSVDGGAGDDLIYGDSSLGEAPNTPTTTVRESLEWNEETNPNGFTQNTGNVDVTFSILSNDYSVDVGFETTTQNVAGIDTGGETIDATSSFYSEAEYSGDSETYALDFSEPVENVAFRINDIDGDGVVRVLAYDANNQPIEIVLTASADTELDLSDTDGVPGDDTAEGDGDYDNDSAADYSILVEIPGPVSQIVIEHSQDGSDDSGINITDVYFDAVIEGPAETGDDTLDGGEGNDTVFGEEGDDLITGGAGDSIIGGEGSDTITIDPTQLDASGDNTAGIFVDGSTEGADNDTLDLTAFVEYRNLAETTDSDGDSTSGTVEVKNADNEWVAVTFVEIESLLLPPKAPDGVVDGEEFGEVMTPGYDDANDPTDGGGDQIDGDDGLDDVIEGNGGDDSINAGLGNDTVDGGADNDTILGGLGDDSVSGGAGDDVLRGNEGNDTVDGGEGDDSMGGAEGDDVLTGGAGNDTLTGGSGNDTLDGGLDADTINGSSGNDVITDMDGDNLITSGIDGTPDLGFPFLGSVDPNPADDLDSVTTGDGNDTINTGDDNDTINAGNGDNVIDGGYDQDVITSGDGNDFIVGGEGDDTITSGGGDDTITGGEGEPLVNLIDDNVNPINNDPILDNGDDLIDAGDGNDLVFGEDDNDTIFGGAGDDTLDGGIDDDVIDGGSGDDAIVGGQGADTMSGGTGDDTFTVGQFTDPIFGDTYLEGLGDSVVGGEDADDGDNDVLDLSNAGPLKIIYDDAIDPTGEPGESGKVIFYTDASQTEVAGELIFKEIETVIPCFTPGAMIATPHGEVPVETLRQGDKVLTRDNGIQEIRWIGSRTLTRPELLTAPNLRPILIKAGSLGDGLPERDMLVSPQHRVLAAGQATQLYFAESEVLVAAKHLVGTEGIQQIDTLRTTYVHFMFDRHEVVLSDGAWTESFQPGDMTLGSMGEAQRDEILALFPELETHVGQNDYAAARRTLKAHEAKLLQL